MLVAELPNRARHLECSIYGRMKRMRAIIIPLRSRVDVLEGDKNACKPAWVVHVAKFASHDWLFLVKRITFRKKFYLRDKWRWRSGESARLQPMCPGFNSGPVSYVGWVCSWSSLCSEGFSQGFYFSSLLVWAYCFTKIIQWSSCFNIKSGPCPRWQVNTYVK